jgi:integral membrane protein (TIGR01906 family)
MNTDERRTTNDERRTTNDERRTIRAEGHPSLVVGRWSLVVIAVPVFLLLTNVRLVMSEAYVRWEYTKPGFPPADLLSAEVRYTAAVTTVDYARGARPVEAIIELSDGNRKLYNQREIRHLIDARNVATAALIANALSLAVITVGGLYLGRRKGRRAVVEALRAGSGLTIALLVGLAVIALVNFNWFFTRFHQLFFEGDTWLFLPTDTLIQLYPLPFWFDVAILLAALTIAEALILFLATWFWLTRSVYNLQKGLRP